MEYYCALGITRSADDVQIKRAFRRLALKFHPDLDDSEAAKQEFNRVCEAYDVLSNARTKGLYDLHGEEHLKTQCGEDGLQPLYHFDAETTPSAVFARFFGTNNPYEAFKALSEKFESLTSPVKPAQSPDKTYNLELSLEEIYHGCLKQIQHDRKRFTEEGSYELESRTLTVDVKPGLPDGTSFIFAKEGDLVPGSTPGSLVYRLVSKQHDIFTRRGADLLHQATVPLYQALIGTMVPIKMLDGRLLNVPITDIVAPGNILKVPNEGMPKPSGGKGDLLVQVKVLYPYALTDAQKMLLKAAFFLPQKPTVQQAKAVKAFELAFHDSLTGWSTGFANGE